MYCRGQDVFIKCEKIKSESNGKCNFFYSIFDIFKERKKLSNKLKIIKQKYVMKSSYLTFSKKSLSSNNEKEIKNISNNK